MLSNFFINGHIIICIGLLFCGVLIAAFVAISISIKKNKKSNTQLESLKAHLETMVDERTCELTASNIKLQEEIVKREHAQEALRQAKDAAEAANQAKSEYLANLSHELRTPLNAILGFSQLLERNPEATHQQREYLWIINRSGEHLLALINDVLELSKIEAGQIHLNMTQFNLHLSIKGIEEMIRGRAEEKRLKFNVNYDHSPVYIEADESKFRQILINLLNNAIKFTDKGSINVKVYCDPSHDTPQSKSKRLNIKIEDTGIGVPETEMHAIFSAFSRGSHDKYGKEGVGLGLAICKKLIHLLGGDIQVEASEKGGSVFHFFIQYNEVSTVSANVRDRHMIQSVDKNWQHVRILVAEDKWENRQLLKNLLIVVGFQVDAVKNGQEAIQLFQEKQPALIFMDIRMPLLSGTEATQKIRSMPGGNKVKIIAITAHAFEEFREDIIAVGCDDLIRKPYRESDIFNSISKHVGVTFVKTKYDHPTVSNDAVELSQKELSMLSEADRNQLKKAAIDLDVSCFERIVARIQMSYPELGNQLLELSKQFRYDQVLKFIDGK